MAYFYLFIYNTIAFNYKGRDKKVEFLVVSKTKLKAILDKEDMLKYKLDATATESDSALTRRAFREILAVAVEEVGFDTDKDKVLIQLYPSRDGGGELFVTKLGALAKSDIKAISDSNNVTMLANISRLYKFDDLDTLILGAKSIHCRDIPSDVYYINGSYYLCAVEKWENGNLSEISKLCEFAQRLPEKLMPYVKEQGKMIFANDAIAKISAL